MPTTMTPAQRRALANALNHNGYVCPGMRAHAAAQTALLKSLQAKGWITADVAPQITDAGRAALADCPPTPSPERFDDHESSYDRKCFG